MEVVGDDDILKDLRDRALIPGVILKVNNYLDFKDSLVSMNRVCKEWNQIIPQIPKIVISDWERNVGNTLYPLDATETVLDDAIIVRDDTVQIFIKCRWKDQGWGNKKSRLYLKLNQFDANGDAEEVYSEDVFGLAEHRFETVTRNFESSSALVIA